MWPAKWSVKEKIERGGPGWACEIREHSSLPEHTHAPHASSDPCIPLLSPSLHLTASREKQLLGMVSIREQQKTPSSSLLWVFLFTQKIDKYEGQRTCFIVSFCSKFPDIFSNK